MASLPYIPINIPDYLADTWHLTTEEHGAYFLLIMNYWQTQKPIPLKRVQSIIRLDNDRYNAVMGNLLEFFNEDNDECLVHERIERDLIDVRTKSEQRSAAGKASAQKRWGAKSVDSGGSDGSPIDSLQRDNNKRVTNKNKNKNNTDNKNDKEIGKSSRFIPPSQNEVLDYMVSKNFNHPEEAERFVNFYESNGWKVGKNKMKKWQSAVGGWIGRSDVKNKEPTMREKILDNSWADDITDNGFGGLTLEHKN